jgi:hypothetical protein
MQPTSPNCQQVLQASLLKNRGRRGTFIPGVSAVLRPPKDMAIVEYAGSLLKKAGLPSPTAVRYWPELPIGRWIVRVEPAPGPDFAADTDPLLCAAILGLSSTTFYSPDRPVVWTQDRLSRAITLHRLGNFYAD